MILCMCMYVCIFSAKCHIDLQTLLNSQGGHVSVSLKAAVSRAAEETNTYLMTLMNEKYHLLAHSSALKRYLLLGQGDFIQLLFDRISPELDKSATSLFRHNLQSVVQHALRSHPHPHPLTLPDISTHTHILTALVFSEFCSSTFCF